MKPLDMYSNSSQLHLISGIFGVSRIFYYFFWNCWTGHLQKKILKHIYFGFFKIETFTYCFTTLECNRFPIQVFFSHELHENKFFMLYQTLNLDMIGIFKFNSKWSKLLQPMCLDSATTHNYHASKIIMIQYWETN